MASRVTVFREQALREALAASTSKRVEIAHRIEAESQASAPVQTGEYRDGIHVEQSGDRVSVVDDDPESIYKEYGTSDTRAHATLTDTARRYGRYSGYQPRGR